MEKFSTTYQKKINLELDERTLDLIVDNIYDCFLDSLNDYLDEPVDTIPGNILERIFKHIADYMTQDMIWRN